MSQPKRKKAPPKRGRANPPPAKAPEGSKRPGKPTPVVLPATLVTVAPSQGGDSSSAQWLREQCKYMYTASLRSLTLVDISETPGVKGHVAIRTLEAWSAEDGWVELRRKNAEEWGRRLAQEAGDQIVAAHRVMLDNLQELSGTLYQQLQPTESGFLKHEVSSYEGLGQLYVRVLGAMEALLTSGIERAMGVAGNTVSPTQTPIQSDMTLEDARIGAHAILEARRVAQDKAHAASGAVVPGESPKREGW